MELYEFLLNYVISNEIAEDDHREIKLIVEEILSNITAYAYKYNDYHDITVDLSCDEKSISVTFTDTGIAFNPVTNGANCIQNIDPCEGGMGIHIIQSLSGTLEYKRIDRRNVLTVTKSYTRC